MEALKALTHDDKGECGLIDVPNIPHLRVSDTPSAVRADRRQMDTVSYPWFGVPESRPWIGYVGGT